MRTFREASPAARPIARLRLAKVPASAVADRERPPVFHFFEEIYARTLRDVEARATGATRFTGDS